MVSTLNSRGVNHKSGIPHYIKFGVCEFKTCKATHILFEDVHPQSTMLTLFLLSKITHCRLPLNKITKISGLSYWWRAIIELDAVHLTLTYTQIA